MKRLFSALLGLTLLSALLPGCAARPESIIAGVVKGLSVLEEKHRKLKATGNHGVPLEKPKAFGTYGEEDKHETAGH